MAYATIEQYERRYGVVADADMLDECLEECSAYIDEELDKRGIDHADPSETYAYRLMMACRSLAHRIMPASGETDVPVGVTQMSLTTGPYNRQFTFGGGYGTPKLNDYERNLLGIGARIGFGALAGDA
jgi:hypothetical protein